MALRATWSCLVLLLLAPACGGGGDQSAPPGGGVARLNTDGAGLARSIAPEICCDGPRAYAVWYDLRDGLPDIYFRRSVDGGATWVGDDRRLDTDAPGSAASYAPQICCAGDTVYVVWHDERGGLPDIYFNRSLDGGATWLAQDVRLDTDTAGAASSRDPVICCAGANVYVAWADKRAASWDLYFNRSLDQGATWLTVDVRIDRDTGTGPDDSAEMPQIGCAGEVVYVAWLGDSGSCSPGVRFTVSHDAGTTWPPTEKWLHTAGLAFRPRLACSGSSVYVVWTDSISGAPHVHFNRSLDGGASWLSADIRLDETNAPAHSPDICAEGLHAYVVWSDGRDAPLPGPEQERVTDIYFDQTRDGGSTWRLADLRLGDDAPGADSSVDPRICCDGEHLHVSWLDALHGQFDVLLTHSPDRGASWLKPVVRLDGDTPGAAASLFQRLCCDGARAVCTWSDNRDGEWDIYAAPADFGALMEEPQPGR